ncbi:MAG TPA: methylated-DNA--[protein]-cysteine S-methyltransferase, partial [Thermoanaerobaculia bacterium]
CLSASRGGGKPAKGSSQEVSACYPWLEMEAQPRVSSTPESAPQPLRVLMPSPLGPLGIEILGTALTRILFEPDEPERSTFTPLHEIDGSDFLDEVFGRLAEYFAGARRRLDLELDLCASGTDPFARRVLKEAAKIPYGRTRSCRSLAEAVGRPEHGAEMVAILLGNPLPIVVPCHRVVAEDGTPGEYLGGIRRKLWLLELEAQGSEPL